MKYAFIVNPASGRFKNKITLKENLEQLIADNPDKDIKMFTTEGEKDATVLADYIAKKCKEDNNEEVAIFACGGDGTIQEVVNGIYGNDNAILGVVPVGSGNDFVRQIGGATNIARKYMDLNAQLQAESVKIELIKMTWVDDSGETKQRFVANGVNIGFDGYIAMTANELRNTPGVSGSGSYLLSIAKNLKALHGTSLKITTDGDEFINGDLLLATVANGGYCGGGVRSCPDANLNDGLLEVLAIKNVNRRDVISLFPSYKKGKLLNNKRMQKKVKYRQAKEVHIKPLEKDKMKFVADGEAFETGEIKLEVVPEVIRVIVL